MIAFVNAVGSCAGDVGPSTGYTDSEFATCGGFDLTIEGAREDFGDIRVGYAAKTMKGHE